MKSLFYLLFFSLSFSITARAQESQPNTKKGTIGITFSTFTDNDIVRFTELIGAASYDVDKFFAVGINYLYPVKKWLDVETGLEYKYYKVVVHPALGVNVASYSKNISLVDIPISLRINFLKYCFVNGGLLLNIDMSSSSPIDDQSGIGSLLGLGLKYRFKSGLSVFANPYFKINAMIPFSSEDYHQHILESGIRFGLGFNL